jgi:hypothetical protein
MSLSIPFVVVNVDFGVTLFFVEMRHGHSQLFDLS